VAEMFYPEAAFPVIQNPAKINQNGYTQKQQLLKRNDKGSNEIGQAPPTTVVPAECDGVDEIGCFQVRLFYDWFLIPGSCQCWKSQFDFTRIHQSH